MLCWLSSMKDYDRQIIWVDYFDSSLSREEGRKVPISRAVKNPTLKELEIAAKKLGLEPQAFEARHPKRPFRQSGYISVKKKFKKSKLISEIATQLIALRKSKES